MILYIYIQFQRSGNDKKKNCSGNTYGYFIDDDYDNDANIDYDLTMMRKNNVK